MDRIEIRLLGPLRVRRQDGSLVDPREWRTRKTAELLMLLALHAGEPVPVDALLEALWPDAGPERGRASLRTALSRLRSALQSDPFERDPRGPVMSGVWVDTHVFDELAARAHRSWASGDPEQAFAVAGEAESLCLTHLVPDATGAWAEPHRERHLATHRALLGDAAEAALELQQPREAAELAERLLELDPFQERGCRTLMLAATAIGEMDRALQAYSACASRLADELGADPSPQTQAVYLQVLRSGPVSGRRVPFVGRDEELAALATELESTDPAGRLLVVHGEPGTGTTQLVHQALAAAGTTGALTGTGARLAFLLEQAERQEASGAPWPVLVVDRLHEADAASITALQQVISLGGVVVATCPTTALTGPSALAPALVHAAATGRVWKLRVPPLSDAALRELAGGVLAGEPGDELVAELARRSRRRPGRAVAVLEEWLSRGAVVGSGRGLALVPPGSGSTAWGTRDTVARLQERLSGPTYEVLEAAAVLGEHATADRLQAVTGRPAAEVAQALGELRDLSVLSVDAGRYRLGDPLLHVALLAWLRPSVRRGLHRRAAQVEDLPRDVQAGHWRAAGDPGEAAAAALASAEELAAVGRLEEACERLRDVLDGDAEIDPALRLHLAERLGDHLAQHGAGDAADRVYDSAVRTADAQGLAVATRLAVKARPSRPSARGSADGTPDEAGPTSPVPDAHELEHSLRVRIESAARAGEHRLAVAAQVELCASVLTPQRRLDELNAVATAAQYLAPTPQLRAQAVLAAAEPEVLLGGASRWVSVLLEAVTSAPFDGGLATGLPPGRLLALALHDVGQDGSVGIPRGEGWLVSRVLLERGDVSAAVRALGPPLVDDRPCAVVLDLVTRAQLRLELGDREEGREQLRRALDLALGLGVTLLVPEVAARLAAEEAHEDEDAAIEHLDLAELTLGEAALPRERIAMLLGRASVRATRQGPRAAVDVARSAAHLASKAGLVHLEAVALRVVASCESAPHVVGLARRQADRPARSIAQR